jgi:hypothetical protein
MHGVKETKELLTGLFALVKVLGVELKDGFQVSDLIASFNAIQNDPVKKAAVEAALKDIKEVPVEVKDVSLAEGIELAMHVISEVPSLIEAFKKA